MTNEELLTISSLPNAAIIAPAGHGKTEMIADIVEHSQDVNYCLHILTRE